MDGGPACFFKKMFGIIISLYFRVSGLSESNLARRELQNGISVVPKLNDYQTFPALGLPPERYLSDPSGEISARNTT